MDRDQFDRLSRLVVTAGSRRAALRLLLSGAIAGMAAGEGAAAKKGKRSRAGKRGSVRAQQNDGACPSECTQDCSTKPLHGGVNLTRCDLNGRDLEGVNLRGSNLSRACFGGANLRDADLRGTNVSRTCFCAADLSGADFRGSNVTARQLACTSVACDTILPNGKPAAPCPKGRTCCNHVCVPIDVDPTNCGACGQVCGPLQICQNGRCLVRPAPCLPPDTDLQSAIDGATSGDTLSLCAGRFRAVNLVVTKNLIITGAGRDQTILDGQNQAFVLTVQGLTGTINIDVVLISLTVTGSGGGRTAVVNVPDFANNGPLPYLALNDVEISNNDGPGIVNEGGMGISQSRITNNGTNLDGGGLFSSSSSGAYVSDSSIDHNTALGTGGGIFLGNGQVYLRDTDVRDNSPNNCATADPNKTIPGCTN